MDHFKMTKSFHIFYLLILLKMALFLCFIKLISIFHNILKGICPTWICKQETTRQMPEIIREEGKDGNPHGTITTSNYYFIIP